MVKERPILFSGPMIRAILDGKKTQTRRVVKPQPEYRENVALTGMHGTFVKGGWNLDVPAARAMFLQSCPYGKAGDRLWVRETFYCDLGMYAAGGRLPKEAEREVLDTLYYRANGDCCQQIPECQCSEVGKPKWRPSIFMPRWASRITLEITGIRVERLQDISRADIDAEGVLATDEWIEYEADMGPLQSADAHVMTPREYWADRWNRINGKKHPWDSNPWVWVVEFKQVEAANA